MNIFTDHKRTVGIDLKNWDEERQQWSPDWSADFYETGGLKDINEDGRYAAMLESHGLDGEEPVLEVDDVDYLLDYADDMIHGVRDFDSPSPDTHLSVTDME